MSETKSVAKSRPATAASRKEDDLISHKSFASRASRASAASRKSMQGSKMLRGAIEPDEVSTVSIDEADEWTAILKFNSLLHYEEKKAAAAREAERRKLLNQELDKQRRAKEEKKQKERKEAAEYFKLQQEHLKLLDQKEKDKKSAIATKIAQEKKMREAQVVKNQIKRKEEAKKNLE